ncbi:putative NPR1/NH1-interacting protein [Medicago truncatula]|uniref:Putative NPR1/NH1-interacting protein n=1 Tax=Medicago truncatula TaxID=3880 RepID=A0A396JUP6_MEDTR|nr:putative NPR1/NH1-interacting protein [Medicago truncatula]
MSLYSSQSLETTKKQPRNYVLLVSSFTLPFIIFILFSNIYIFFVNMEINGSKKRKICNEELDEEKQKEEEEKIETFFALVRNMRETRDRWRNKMSENIKEENRVVGVWKPTFKLEDFAEEGASKSNNINCANIIKEDDTEKGINLKLSL